MPPPPPSSAGGAGADEGGGERPGQRVAAARDDERPPWLRAADLVGMGDGDVKKALQSAIANAENNHSLDVDRLFVKEAHVGKAIVMKRFKARARGRGARILKPFSHLTIVVGEKGDQ